MKEGCLLACHVADSYISSSDVATTSHISSHILGQHRRGYSNWPYNCSCDAKGSHNCDCHQEKFCIHGLSCKCYIIYKNFLKLIYIDAVRQYLLGNVPYRKCSPSEEPYFLRLCKIELSLLLCHNKLL